MGADTTQRGPFAVPTAVASGERLQSLVAAGATQALDLRRYSVFDITLTADCTVTFTHPPVAGADNSWTLIIRQGGSGSYTITWPAAVSWPAANGTPTSTPPVLFTAVTAVNIVILSTDDGGVTYGANLVESGGTRLLAQLAYDGNNANYHTTSTTLTDVDATHLAITFTAPASGNVLVRVIARVNNNTHNGYFGLREGSTSLVTPRFVCYNTVVLASVDFYLTGVSAGSHTYKLAFVVDPSGGMDVACFPINTGVGNIPVVMEVWG